MSKIEAKLFEGKRSVTISEFVLLMCAVIFSGCIYLAVHWYARIRDSELSFSFIDIIATLGAGIVLVAIVFWGLPVVSDDQLDAGSAGVTWVSVFWLVVLAVFGKIVIR